MENLEKYNEVFMTAFSLAKEQLNSQLEYDSIPEWDSVGHMGMVAGLEDSFDIILEMDDIIDFSSYEVGKQILKKYDIII